MVLSAEEEHLPVGRHRRPELPECGTEPRHEGGVVLKDGQRLDAVHQRVFENPEVALQAPVRPAPLSPPVRRRNGPEAPSTPLAFSGTGRSVTGQATAGYATRAANSARRS